MIIVDTIMRPIKPLLNIFPHAKYVFFFYVFDVIMPLSGLVSVVFRFCLFIIIITWLCMSLSHIFVN